jgi:hypothetical protein
MMLGMLTTSLTFAMLKVLYFINAFDRTSSFTSLPRSLQNILKSSVEKRSQSQNHVKDCSDLIRSLLFNHGAPTGLAPLQRRFQAQKIS